MTTPASRVGPLILLAWAAVAVATVGMGFLTRVPFPPPVFVASGVLFALAMIVLVPGVAAWLRELDLRVILSFHLVRFVGAFFLWLAVQGRLPYSFARPAGIGDIITAVWAAGLLVTGYARPGKALLFWNLFGVADILFVVFNAVRGIMTDPASFTEFYHLPLGLLPTFIVPVIIVSHGVVFLRLRSLPAST